MDDKEMVLTTDRLICNFITSIQEENKNLPEYLKNSVEIASEFIEKYFGDYLSEKGIKTLNLNFELVDSQTIQEVNSEHRNKDKVTDVLSFPAYENIRGLSEEEFVVIEDAIELGDLMICHEITQKQSEEFQITYNQELSHLFFHGMLHLLGFDHEINEYEEELMQAHEKFLVTKLYKKMGLEN